MIGLRQVQELKLQQQSSLAQCSVLEVFMGGHPIPSLQPCPELCWVQLLPVALTVWSHVLMASHSGSGLLGVTLPPLPGITPAGTPLVFST